jgi:hypothetical protein
MMYFFVDDSITKFNHFLPLQIPFETAYRNYSSGKYGKNRHGQGVLGEYRREEKERKQQTQQHKNSLINTVIWETFKNRQGTFFGPNSCEFLNYVLPYIHWNRLY